MHITVKFFAGLKDQFAEPQMQIQLDHDKASVTDVWREVSQNDALPANVLSAVNLEYAQADDMVQDGDEVAFFPPVTGG